MSADNFFRFVRTTKMCPLSYKERLIYSAVYFASAQGWAVKELIRRCSMGQRLVYDCLGKLTTVGLIEKQSDGRYYAVAGSHREWFQFVGDDIPNAGQISYFRLRSIKNPLRGLPELWVKDTALLAAYFGLPNRTIRHYRNKARNSQPKKVAEPEVSMYQTAVYRFLEESGIGRDNWDEIWGLGRRIFATPDLGEIPVLPGVMSTLEKARPEHDVKKYGKDIGRFVIFKLKQRV